MWKRTRRPDQGSSCTRRSSQPGRRFASQILSISVGIDAANRKTLGIMFSFMQVAYVDPSDPSVLYLSQPTAVAGSEERSFSEKNIHVQIQTRNSSEFRQHVFFHCAANRTLKIGFTWVQRSEPTLRLMLPPHLQRMAQARS